jgi:hypothetical protein
MQIYADQNLGQSLLRIRVNPWLKLLEQGCFRIIHSLLEGTVLVRWVSRPLFLLD